MMNPNDRKKRKLRLHLEDVRKDLRGIAREQTPLEICPRCRYPWESCTCPDPAEEDKS